MSRHGHSERRAWGSAWAIAAVTCCVLMTPTRAASHGIWGHIHVTGWAIENLPEGELSQFFEDPEVFNAALFGAAFTDSGYWPQGGDLARASRAYGEHTHWEPFIEDFIEWIRVNDPPPWQSQESRKRVAFLMGCAAHGLQDEVFDSLFLPQIDVHDGAGQDQADPASDGFLALDMLIRFEPEEDIPMEALLELYEVLDEPVTEEVIRQSVAPMMRFYVNHRVGIDVATGQGLVNEEPLQWTRRHYMDPAVPGSLRAEIFPTMHYLNALWERLHGRFDANQVVTATYPELPRSLRGHEAALPDSWVTLLFGAGVRYDSVTTRWQHEDDGAVPFEQRNTRWNNGWTRLVRLQPTSDLTPGAHYDVALDPGAELIDGQITAEASTLRFQVACVEENADDCEPLDDVPVATIDDPNPQAPEEPQDPQDPQDPTSPSNNDVPTDDTLNNDTPDSENPATAPESRPVGFSKNGCGAAIASPPAAPPGRTQGLLAGLLLALLWVARRRSHRVLLT